MASPHVRVLRQIVDTLSLSRAQMSYRRSVMRGKVGGVGKEWDSVCVHECVQLQALGVSKREGRKESKLFGRCFLYMGDPALNLLSPPL